MKTRFIFLTVFLLLFAFIQDLNAQRGYYDAPYKRYEADAATLSGGAVSLEKSYAQTDVQSEASDQVCVDMSSTEATVEFTLSELADGLVLRYSVPDGDSAIVGVYSNNIKITSLTLTSKWSWEYLWSNGDPNNNGIVNKNPKMRFDEVRYKLPEKSLNLKLVKESGELMLDFIEMEPVPSELNPPEGAVVYAGDGSTLQAFIDANGSKTIFIPPGLYNIGTQLYIGVSKTKLQGAGMWYSQLNFTETKESNGGLRANAEEISYSDLFITSEMTTRTKGYAGIHGVYTQGSTIRNLWIEHCATGAWIGQYVPSGPAFADGVVISDCRFRNTYADGINLCKGTRNAIVEHCNFRNNGDDGMAIWSAEGLECINNTFRYNTVENGWRAAGAALYGGKDNKFYNLIVKDNVEVGITITNTFPGVGFNENGLHDFHDITLIGCGTFNAVYNDRVGAINIYHANSAGKKVQNIRFHNIDIIDSKSDAIRIAKSSGEGIANMSFENVTINGTGKEFPYNNVNNVNKKRGFAVYFDLFPIGMATYCGLNSSNLGGDSEGIPINTTSIGNFKWEELTGCETQAATGIILTPEKISIAGADTVRLVPVFTPENVTNRIVTFVSSNPKVATVNYEGIVTGLSKGTAIITVTTQEGNFSASSEIEVTSNPMVYYKIKNRWQSTYLYDGGDRVKYSASSNGNNYLWEFEEIDNAIQIKNISTEDYMHIEDLTGYVQCTSVSAGAEKTKWILENVDDNIVRLKSAGNGLDFIHIENLQGQAQYGPIENSWWSAMWILEPVMVITSVPDISVENTMGIFPNPNNGEFNFIINNFDAGEKIVLTILNLAGQVVYSNTYEVNGNGSKTIKLDKRGSLKTGNYIVMAAGNSNIAKGRLVVSK